MFSERAIANAPISPSDQPRQRGSRMSGHVGEVDAADQPEQHAVRRVLVEDDQHLGERDQQAARRHAGQREADRAGPTRARSPASSITETPETAAPTNASRMVGAPGQRRHDRDREDDDEHGARVDAHDLGRRERVAATACISAPLTASAAPTHERQHDPRQPDGAHDQVLGRVVVRERVQDLAQRHVFAADPTAPQGTHHHEHQQHDGGEAHPQRPGRGDLGAAPSRAAGGGLSTVVVSLTG